MEKENCFAYKNKNKCIALNHKNCGGCKFYKTKKKYEAELKKYSIREKEI